jgi:cytochrome c biogenesis protein CcdA
MEDMYFDMIRKAKQMTDDFRQEIRESKHGLLKLVGIELFPIAMGASLAGIGRATGAHWIPAVPVGIDLIGNATGYTSARGLLGLAKYGLGVALPYADKIYLAVQENMPLISQTINSILEKA